MIKLKNLYFKNGIQNIFRNPLLLVKIFLSSSKTCSTWQNWKRNGQKYVKYAGSHFLVFGIIYVYSKKKTVIKKISRRIHVVNGTCSGVPTASTISASKVVFFS